MNLEWVLGTIEHELFSVSLAVFGDVNGQNPNAVTLGIYIEARTREGDTASFGLAGEAVEEFHKAINQCHAEYAARWERASVQSK